MSTKRLSRRLLLLVLAAAGVVALVSSPREPQGRVVRALDRAALDQSLRLGTQFLLQHQRPEGNFDYEYNWLDKTYNPRDSQVRQAGAAWGLALIYQDEPSPELRQGIERAIRFFRSCSRSTADGRRYVAYPGDERGALGTVALIALTYIDYLRAVGDELDGAARTRLEGELDGYLAFIVAAQRYDGRFYERFDFADGRPLGESSPYFDGESLLALTKAAKYLGREELRGVALAAADAGYAHNNVEAREQDPDSSVTKGYYQWSSMSYFELATCDWGETEKYGDWLIELADWMIDIHRTLDRTRNTAYAYEGIIPAYRMAVLRGDTHHEQKFGYVIERGLSKLTSWQIGHELANRYVAEHHPDDRAAIGGVQNHAFEPQLRIDVAQHQMHAVLLARRYYWPSDEGD